jgi:hypothetical protein
MGCWIQLLKHLLLKGQFHLVLHRALELNYDCINMTVFGARNATAIFKDTDLCEDSIPHSHYDEYLRSLG